VPLVVDMLLSCYKFYDTSICFSWHRPLRRNPFIAWCRWHQ
jgi:hypothetical protein